MCGVNQTLEFAAVVFVVLVLFKAVDNFLEVIEVNGGAFGVRDTVVGLVITPLTKGRGAEFVTLDRRNVDRLGTAHKHDYRQNKGSLHTSSPGRPREGPDSLSVVRRWV